MKLKNNTKVCGNLDERYILHLASWYPNKSNLNEGVFIQNQVRAISTNHPSVLINVVESGKNTIKSITKNEFENLQEYIVYQPQKFLRQVGYFFAFWSAFKKIKKEKGLPELVHVHVMFRASLIGWLINVLYKVPYIITEHSTVFTDASPLRRRDSIIRFNKFFAKKASVIIVVSEYLKGLLVNHGFHDIKVIPNIVDTAIFHNAQRPENEIKKFLHVSNLKEEHKNVKPILKAFDVAMKAGGLFKMTIVGSNEINLKKLKKYQKQNHPSLDIDYLGRQTQMELGEIYRNHDVLVQYSKYETFSLVIAEAMACGMFVISSDIGGPKELIQKFGNGVLVPLESEEMLVSEIFKATEKLEMEAIDINEFGEEEFLISYDEIIKALL